MSETTVVHTDGAPKAIGPYSQAIAARGLLFASGQIPLVPSTGELLRGDIQEQTHQVLRNLAAVLEASGASLSTVVKTTVFLADMGEFAAMNEVYAEHFGDHRPARSTVQAGALPRNVSVEVDAIALLP
ncbi:MAG: RidA family protein [Gammaproteobacteria bacterium]|nr:RidA family protein [Gammaproteobacteria bacterium]MDE0259650.1 RidA family protein [Gammaproteobacteria bacterium]